MNADERFLTKVAKRSAEECWQWRGSINRVTGYGAFRIAAGKMMSAHRYSKRLDLGELPTGKMVLHTCDNKLCVNPAHLYIGTGRDNMRDRLSRGLQLRAANGQFAAP